MKKFINREELVLYGIVLVLTVFLILAPEQPIPGKSSPGMDCAVKGLKTITSSYGDLNYKELNFILENNEEAYLLYIGDSKFCDKYKNRLPVECTTTDQVEEKLLKGEIDENTIIISRNPGLSGLVAGILRSNGIEVNWFAGNAGILVGEKVSGENHHVKPIKIKPVKKKHKTHKKDSSEEDEGC